MKHSEIFNPFIFKNTIRCRVSILLAPLSLSCSNLVNAVKKSRTPKVNIEVVVLHTLLPEVS